MDIRTHFEETPIYTYIHCPHSANGKKIITQHEIKSQEDKRKLAQTLGNLVNHFEVEIYSLNNIKIPEENTSFYPLKLKLATEIFQELINEKPNKNICQDEAHLASLQVWLKVATQHQNTTKSTEVTQQTKSEVKPTSQIKLKFPDKKKNLVKPQVTVTFKTARHFAGYKKSTRVLVPSNATLFENRLGASLVKNVDPNELDIPTKQM